MGRPSKYSPEFREQAVDWPCQVGLAPPPGLIWLPPSLAAALCKIE